MPFLAILQHDLRSLWQSRLVRLWLVAAAVLTLLLTATNWAQLQTAPLIAALLVPYLVFPWFLVVIVLGVNPVSGSRTETLADGILSGPVTRHEYVLAAWSARVVLVLGCFLVVIVPAVALVALAKRDKVAEDPVTFCGVVSALAVVGLVLTFLVSLGFLMGTLLRKPLFAVVVLIFVWYPITLVLSAFSLEEFSPISLNQAIPTLLRQPWRGAETNAQDESNREDAEEIARTVTSWTGLLTGEEPKPEPEADKPGFLDRQDFDDFSLIRVTLGYGIPTVLAIALTTLCFYWRDL